MDTSMSVYSNYLHFPHDLSSMGSMTMTSADMTRSVSMVNALLLLTGLVPSADSVITNVSVIQSWNWFFQLTPFEGIFMGLIIAQIAILQYLQILPINLNKLINGDPLGRKKRHASNTLPIREKMVEAMMNVLKRMDREECFFRALCHIQNRYQYDPSFNDLPREIQLTIEALKMSSERRKKNKESPSVEIEESFFNSEEKSDAAALKPKHPIEILEEAIDIGMVPPSGNVTMCEKRYRLCPASTEDIFSYLDELKTNYYVPVKKLRKRTTEF